MTNDDIRGAKGIENYLMTWFNGEHSRREMKVLADTLHALFEKEIWTARLEEQTSHASDLDSHYREGRVRLIRRQLKKERKE